MQRESQEILNVIKKYNILCVLEIFSFFLLFFSPSITPKPSLTPKQNQLPIVGKIKSNKVQKRPLVVNIDKSINSNYLHRIDYRCLMTFSTMFQLYHGSHFYWWRKLDLKKTTDLPPVSDKLNNVILYQVHISRQESKIDLLIIGTDSICRYKSSYHTITAMTVHSMYKSMYCKTQK